MAFTRQQSREKPKCTYLKSEYVASEADSTVAHWGPATSQAPKRSRSEPFTQQGVDWQNLPDGPLLRMFELMFADKEARADMHNAAATCTQWREAFLEVTLGDTAASRPERPPLAKENHVKQEAPTTTATTCAAVCGPSKSETNGFEACSNRRHMAAGRGAAAAAAGIGTEHRRLFAVPQLRALAGVGAVGRIAGAAAAAASSEDAPALPTAVAGLQRRLRRQRTPGAFAAGADLAGMSQDQQLQPPPTQLAALGEPLQQAAIHTPAGTRRRVGTAASPAHGAGRRTASLTGSGPPVTPATHHTPKSATTGRGGRKAAAGRRQAAYQQHEDEVMQPVATGRGRGRQRHTATATASEGGDALTDEVAQPTTAQGGDLPTAAGRRRRQRASARASAAAAAAVAAGAAPVHAKAETAGDEAHEPADQMQQQLAATASPRARRHQQHHPAQQQQQQQQQGPGGHEQPQQQQADSTEAMAQGEVGHAGAARVDGGEDRQHSGSNRPAGGDHWFGGLFNLPAWFRRGSSS